MSNLIITAACSIAALCNIVLIILLYRWYGPSSKVEKLQDCEAVLGEYPKDETDRARNKRGSNGYLVLIPVSTFGIGAILCAFLETFGLGPFLAALALIGFSKLFSVAVKGYLS